MVCHRHSLIEKYNTGLPMLADYLNVQHFHVARESGGGPYVLACALAMPTRIFSALGFGFQ